MNTFLPKDHRGDCRRDRVDSVDRGVEGAQIANVKLYGGLSNSLVLGSLRGLQDTARERGNVFERLMGAMEYNLLRQISHALHEVGVSAEYVAASPRTPKEIS